MKINIYTLYMKSCPLYNNSNLDSTGNKMNNPYALIQKAGKSKYNKKNKKTNKKKRKNTKKTKRVRFNLHI